MVTPDALPAMGNPAWAGNWTVQRGGLLMEVMDTTTRDVWLCQEPVTRKRYDSLEAPGGFVKSGIGAAVADVAYFRRSPGARFDGPLDAMEIDGLRFVRVARPGKPEAEDREALVLPVDKHHSMFYEAGRAIEVLDAGDGWDYIPQATGAVGLGGRPGDARVLPDGWSVRSVNLVADLVVEVPCPARVVFLKDGSSFQGPVRLDRS